MLRFRGLLMLACLSYLKYFHLLSIPIRNTYEANKATKNDLPVVPFVITFVTITKQSSSTNFIMPGRSDTTTKTLYQHTDLLRQFGLARNPFTDRTAEKTGPLDDISLLVPSELRDYQPTPITYVFFGKRGSGKTTIRLMMQRSYIEENTAKRSTGKSRGFFLIDLSKPGHMTARLRAFQHIINATDDNWDALFSENWSTADFVDCLLSFVATELIKELTDLNSVEGADMVRRAASDPRASRQLLLFMHLYADCDANTLKILRALLLNPRFSSTTKLAATGTALVVASGVLGASITVSRHNHQGLKFLNSLYDLEENVVDSIHDTAPFLWSHPQLSFITLGAVCTGAAWMATRAQLHRALSRATALSAPVRVVTSRSPPEIASLLRATFSASDTPEVIRSLCIGNSAHQKLDKLESLLKLLGFDGLAVFADCLDEIFLLDPVNFPTALKVFSREACRNDLLNFGRMHFFFPDSRLALDLNTDRALKEARFDRHFVRDLTWSRHQLEELAQRRFIAAQLAAQRMAAVALGSSSSPLSVVDGGHHHHHQLVSVGPNNADTATSVLHPSASFADLFKDIKTEDVSSYLSKLSTPRELMMMMSELFSRLESNPEGGITAQDLEIATQRALEQAV